jgi:hypothetical protein
MSHKYSSAKGWAAVPALLLAAVGVLSIAPIAAGAGSPGQLAIARAINLRAADLPGFTSHPGGGNGASPFGSQINSTCSGLVGAGQHRRTAHAGSPLFMSTSGLRSEEVQSAVEIEHSRRVVRHDLAVGRSKHTRVCIASVLGALKFTEQGTQFTITNVRVTPLRVVIPGTNGSFGLRINAAVSGVSISIPFTIDMIGIAVGRDEISLTAEGTDRRFPRKTEHRLTQLLVSRALALPR